MSIPPVTSEVLQLSRGRHLQVYFPNVYDIKYLMKFCGNLHGGLNKLAETLDVARIGPQHQVHLVLTLPNPTPTFVCSCKLAPQHKALRPPGHVEAHGAAAALIMPCSAGWLPIQCKQ